MNVWVWVCMYGWVWMCACGCASAFVCCALRLPPHHPPPCPAAQPSTYKPSGLRTERPQLSPQSHSTLRDLPQQPTGAPTHPPLERAKKRGGKGRIALWLSDPQPKT